MQGGTAKYVGSVGGSAASNADSDNDFKQFAQDAVQQLKQSCPSSIVDGTVRVDIMLFNGRKVVNEFESLEAGIFSKFINLQLCAKDQQRKYWARVLYKILRYYN